MNRPTPPKRHRFRPTPLVLALALAISSTTALAQTNSGSASLSTPVQFSIAAKPLGQALGDWAVQSRIQLIVQPDLVAGKVAPAVTGSLAPRQALDRLLGGSGLVAEAQGSAVVIKPAQPAPVAGSVLPVVTVTAGIGDQPGYGTRSLASPIYGDGQVLTTPKTITVITRDVMDDLAASNPYDVTKLDASVQPASPGNANVQDFAIRGLYVDGYNNYRRDGLQGPNSLEPLQSTERLEILKGTAAVLYGFASPGGVINSITKTPTSEHLTRLNLGIDQYGGNTEHLDLSRRFGDEKKSGVRINLSRQGVRAFDRETKGEYLAGAIAFETQLATQTRLSLNATVQDRDLKPNQASAYALLGGTVLPVVDPKRFVGQEWSMYNVKTRVFGAKLETVLGDDWLFAAQYQKFNHEFDFKNANAANVLANGDFTVNVIRQQQERNADSARVSLQKEFSTGKFRHLATIGFTQSRIERSLNSAFVAGVGTNNYFNPVDLPEPITNLPPKGRSFEYDQRSLYLSDRISFGGAWDLHIGGSHQTLKQLTYDFTTGAETGNYSKNTFTPHVALVFKPTNRWSIYGSYSEGLESGGQAPLEASNASEALPPGKTDEIELGTKYQVSDSAIASISIFRMNRPFAYTNAANRFVQDGRERYNGLEAGLSGRLSPTWDVIGTYTFLNAKVTSSDDIQAVGQQLVGVPRHSASLLLQHQIAQIPGMSVLVGPRYVGKRPLLLNNSVFAPSFVAVDLGAKYTTRVSGAPVTLRLNLENAFDKRYWSSAVFGSLVIGAPRTLKMSATVDF